MKPLMIAAVVALSLGFAMPALAAQHDDGFFSASLGDDTWTWDGNEAVMNWESFEHNAAQTARSAGREIQQTARGVGNEFERTANRAQQEWDEGLLDDGEDMDRSGEDTFQTTSNSRYQTTSRMSSDNRFQTTSRATSGAMSGEALRLQSTRQSPEERFDGVIVLTGDNDPQSLAPISVNLDNLQTTRSQRFSFDTRLLLIDLTGRFTDMQQSRVQRVSQNRSNSSEPVITSRQVSPTGNTYDYSDDEIMTQSRQVQQTQSNQQVSNRAPVFTGGAGGDDAVGDGFNDPDLFGDPEDDGGFE